jgi:hypothetical protein
VSKSGSNLNLLVYLERHVGSRRYGLIAGADGTVDVILAWRLGFDSTGTPLAVGSAQRR